MKVLVTLGLVLLISLDFVFASERFSRNNRRNGKKRPKMDIFFPIKPSTKFGEGKVCIGTISRFAKPSSVEQHYKNLKDRYTNCTNIHGNLEITYIEHDRADMSFLDNIKEVTGYVLIHRVHVKNLRFPKLQIIRGTSLQNITGTSHSLVVTQTTLETLELPSLREILHGSAGFYENTHLSHIETIDWTEILSGPNAKFIFDVEEMVTDPYECHPSCLRGDGERACWGPGPHNCQKFSKTICSPQCAGGRCFGTKPRECCHLFCAGGCTGPTQRDCIACKNFYDDGVCKEECPPMQRYNSVNYTWEHNPDGRYAYGATCVKNCPEHLLRDNGACVRSCPINKIPKNGECVPCDGACPKRCPGVQHLVHSGNIESFRNCTVIDGSIRIIENTFNGYNEFYPNKTMSEVSPPMHPDQLEVFSNVKEITGYLDIQAVHKDFKNLSYFRNLEIIHGRILNEMRFAAFSIVQSSLESLHLKSLRRINAGTVLIQLNKNLCFVDGIDWNSIIKAADPRIVISPTNKKHELCVAENQTCSDQCNIQGCWGTGSDECVNCKNFKFNGTCIANCSAVANAYVYDNKTCKSCHPECLGCSAYGDQFCFKCMHIRDGDRCVQQCPENKYNDKGVCRPCHATCHGCTGPRDNIGIGGCNTCSLAIINIDTTVERCLLPNDKCPDGYYKDFVGLQPQEEFQVLAGKSICRKCHPRCEICSGYGFHEQVCSKCRGYKRGEQCEDECPADHYADNVQRECFPCHSECKNCTGPTIRDCMYCRNYKLFDNPDSINNKSSFSCTSRCPSKYSHIIFHKPSIGPYCLSPPPKPSKFREAYSYIALPVFFIIITAIVAYTYNIRSKRLAKKEAVKLSMVLTGFEDSEPLRPSNVGANLTKLRIIKENELKKGNVLGMGAFGKVYQGTWCPEDESIKGSIRVAIKELLETNGVEANKEFLEEAYIMASVDHPNLVKLLAVCMTSRMMLITQLMPLGNLLDYVRNNKNKIGSKALLDWSTQIARGMSYLEERGIVHRDLAARNVLVRYPSIVKITDFGLAKLLNHDSNEYIAPGGKMPIKWLAIECIRHRVFTSKSDVWAFAVTIWEILTFGQKPYENIAAKELPELIEQGVKLNQPECCSLDIYLKLVLCWHLDSDMRPNFKELVLVFSEFARDPGRFLHIPGDYHTRLPSYTSQDEKELIRKIARNTMLENDDYLQPRPDDYNENTDVTDAKMRQIEMGNLKLDLPVDEDDYLMPTCQKNNNTINTNANTTTNLGYMDVLATSSPCIDNPEYLFNNSHSNDAYECNIPTQTLGIPIIKSPRTSLNPHEYYNDLQREMQPLHQGGETRV